MHNGYFKDKALRYSFVRKADFYAGIQLYSPLLTFWNKCNKAFENKGRHLLLVLSITSSPQRVRRWPGNKAFKTVLKPGNKLYLGVFGPRRGYTSLRNPFYHIWCTSSTTQFLADWARNLITWTFSPHTHSSRRTHPKSSQKGSAFACPWPWIRLFK